MSTLHKKLGRKIARQRKLVGLTQAELAERVGVQPVSISRIENGARTPSLEVLFAIAHGLELELHELFRLQPSTDPKHHAVDRLLWFAARLSASEIELLMDVGASVLTFMRKAPVAEPRR